MFLIFTAVVYHDKIFVIGGYDGQMRLKTVEVYNPFQSCRFQLQENRLNVRRSNFSVSVIEDKILVMGGYNGHGVTNR